jgi:hypothetical protein
MAVTFAAVKGMTLIPLSLRGARGERCPGIAGGLERSISPGNNHNGMPAALIAAAGFEIMVNYDFLLLNPLQRIIKSLRANDYRHG